MNRRSCPVIIGLTIFLLGADLLFQRLALAGVEAGGRIVGFALLQNAGIFFQWHPSPRVVWTIIVPISGVVIAQWLIALRRGRGLESMAWIMVILGAASNIVDRTLFGFVIDYFYLWIFPVFNVADILILSGVLLLFFIHREQTVSAKN